MSYEIQFTEDYERRRIAGQLPEELIGQIEAVLNDLRDDPLEKSIIPPSPPFAPVGRLSETICTVDGVRYFVRFFFHVDIEKELIYVRRSSMQPPYRPRQK